MPFQVQTNKFFRRWHHPVNVVVLLVFLVLCVTLGFTLLRGPIHSPDSKSYAALADRLIRSGFDLPRFFEESQKIDTIGLRFGFVSLIALCKVLFGSFWDKALIAVNLLATFFSLFIFGKLWLRLRLSSMTVLLLIPLALLGYENWLYASYVLSDPTYLLLFSACLYLLTLSREEGRKKWLGALLGALALVALSGVYRPTFPILFALWCVSLVWSFGVFRSSKGFAPLMAIVVFVVFAAVTGAIAYLHAHSGAFLASQEETITQLITKYFVKGVIIHDRHDLTLGNLSSLADFLRLGYLRMVYFFSFYNPNYSAAHNLFNGMFYVPVYALALIGFLPHRLGETSTLMERRRKAQFLCVCTLLFHAAFHCFTIIDYDMRYRVPTILPMLTLAGLGCEVLRGLFAKRAHSLPLDIEASQAGSS